MAQLVLIHCKIMAVVSGGVMYGVMALARVILAQVASTTFSDATCLEISFPPPHTPKLERV